jgi:hypothetical protein
MHAAIQVLDQRPSPVSTMPRSLMSPASSGCVPSNAPRMAAVMVDRQVVYAANLVIVQNHVLGHATIELPAPLDIGMPAPMVGTLGLEFGDDRTIRRRDLYLKGYVNFVLAPKYLQHHLGSNSARESSLFAPRDTFSVGAGVAPAVACLMLRA